MKVVPGPDQATKVDFKVKVSNHFKVNFVLKSSGVVTNNHWTKLAFLDFFLDFYGSLIKRWDRLPQIIIKN